MVSDSVNHRMSLMPRSEEDVFIGCHKTPDCRQESVTLNHLLCVRVYVCDTHIFTKVKSPVTFQKFTLIP